MLTARADWLRGMRTPANIAQSLRLDPLNPSGWTLHADSLEQEGRFGEAEQAWRKALAFNRRDGEAWMRTVLLLERRGAVHDSERCLLEAAQVSRTWLPRWALVSFYARHGRKRSCTSGRTPRWNAPRVMWRGCSHFLRMPERHRIRSCDAAGEPSGGRGLDGVSAAATFKTPGRSATDCGEVGGTCFADRSRMAGDRCCDLASPCLSG